MRYNVHVFAVVRVKFHDIEADSQEEAVKLAGDRFYDDDWEAKLGVNSIDGVAVDAGDYAEFADEFQDYLVDEVGDENYERSRRYKYEDGQVTQADVQAGEQTAPEWGQAHHG